MGQLQDDEPTGNIEGIDADALLNEIEGSSNQDIPMTRGEEPAPAADPKAAAAPEEFEITWNGQVIKAPRDKALTWAAQGYDYSQKMAQFNQERSQWESQRKEFEKSYSPYKTIDDYAKQNPDWWNHVDRAYKEALAGGQIPGAQTKNPDLEAIRAELNEIKQFKQSLESDKARETAKQEDEKLGSEVQSIREQYKDLDWNSIDQHGQTLEQRILKHAIDNDIKSFRVAFRDYNHDQLLKLTEDRAKENQTKELQKRTKLGLLGTSPTPKKGISSAEGVKNKSYDDLLREAKEELGIA